MVESKLFASSSDEASEPKTDQNYSKPLWLNLQCSSSAQIPSQANLDDSHRFLSLYKIVQKNKRTELHIYDTENEHEEVKTLDKSDLSGLTSITQLPNGELFCLGGSGSGKALIIDRSYEARMLPYGSEYQGFSVLYFNNNVYIFGGCNEDGFSPISRKFDLKKNRSIYIASLPEADCFCHSVVFNGNILVSGSYSKDLWLYSIEIDSFSIISYNFEGLRKLLVNVDRLYLIEWVEEGLIYESEDEYNLKPIAKSELGFQYCIQMYCLYNNGKIYISAECDYYQFDLKNKVILEINMAKT